jgi:hypothetical protein
MSSSCAPGSRHEENKILAWLEKFEEKIDRLKRDDDQPVAALPTINRIRLRGYG